MRFQEEDGNVKSLRTTDDGRRTTHDARRTTDDGTKTDGNSSSVASRTHRRWCRDCEPDINIVGWEPGWEAPL